RFMVCTPGYLPVTFCSHRSGLRPASFRRRWLGEGIQIREIKARVSVREAEIGTGVCDMDHSFLCPPRRRMKAARSGSRDGASVARTLAAIDVYRLARHEARRF